MSTITREQIEMYASAADATQTFEMDKGKLICVEPEHMLELARIALASLEAEAVCYLTWHQGFRAPDDCEEYVVEAKPGDKSCDGSPAFPVYTAPPAQIVNAEHIGWSGWACQYPGKMPRLYGDKTIAELNWYPEQGDQLLFLSTFPPSPVVPNESAVELLATDLMKRIDKITGERHSVATLSSLRVSIVDACRAAMLQGAEIVESRCSNSPVIPDGWVMVPVEPTEDMIVEGFESWPDEFFSDTEVWEAFQEMSGCQQSAHLAKLCWAAMIAATPRRDL